MFVSLLCQDSGNWARSEEAYHKNVIIISKIAGSVPINNFQVIKHHGQDTLLILNKKKTLILNPLLHAF